MRFCVLIAGPLLAWTLGLQGAVNSANNEAKEETRSPIVKVMSFNIRYAAADDGTNSWPRRRALVAETIWTFNPDLLGMQEVLRSQADYLRERLPGYAFHGVGREDGQEQGEYVPVMYREDRFERLDAGHFWLSETPDVPGSKSWDSSLPRMVSWVILRDRRSDAGPFVFANTHFDHRGPKAREMSARLIRERAALVIDDYPLILCGDFNSTDALEPYAILTRGDSAAEDTFQLLDSYRVIHPNKTLDESTLSGWNGQRQGPRIDWILHSPGWITLNATIDYMQEGGRYPSDHYPVEAVLRRRVP